MKHLRLKKGERVRWIDPDGGTCSRSGTITRISYRGVRNIRDDTMVRMELDNNWFIEALPREIKKLKPRK